MRRRRLLTLALAALLALAAVPAFGQTAPSPAPAGTAAPSPAPSPSAGGANCNVVCVLGGIAGQLNPLNALNPGPYVEAGLQAMIAAFISSATWILRKVTTSLNDNASVDLTAPWFLAHYQVMVLIALVFVLWAGIVGAVKAATFGDGAGVWRALWRAFYGTALMAGPALAIAAAGLALTDWLTQLVLTAAGANVGSGLEAFGARLSSLTAPGTGLPGFGLALLTLLALLAFIGAVLIWLALLVRMAVIYIAMSFVPLLLAGEAHPASQRMAGRVGKLIGGVIASKFIVAAILALAVSWFSAGDTTDVGHDLAFGVVLVLAAAAPWLLVKGVGSLVGIHGAARFAGSAKHATATVRRPVEAMRHSRVLAFARTGRTPHEAAAARGARPAPVGASTTTTYHRPLADGTARRASLTQTQWGPGGTNSTTWRWRRDGTPAARTDRVSSDPPPKDRKPSTAPRRSTRKAPDPRRKQP